MPPSRQPDFPHPSLRMQHGGVLMVMLVIMIIGAAAILVGSLGSPTLKIERDKITANALAQAKEALIGRAVTDGNRPGSLTCPDTNNDGSAELLSGNDCPSYTGRLPWRTLKLPDLRDGAGERLWYALSRNFRDDDSNHINSDAPGTLSISGTSSSSNVIAIVFAPGTVVNGASRSSSAAAACSSLKDIPHVAQSWCATNYLEGSNAALNTWTNPNMNYQSADTSSAFNDRMIFITYQNLMPLIEKRVAREVKTCLDDYALVNANAYPWAAPVSDTTNYAGILNTRFGRLPQFTPYNSNVQLLLNDVAGLQLALNNYSASPNDAIIRQAFIDAGLKLYNDADSLSQNTAPPLTADDLSKAKDAGDKAQPPHTPEITASNTTVQAYLNDFQLTEINLTLTNFAESGVTPGWASGCTLFSSSYWPDWKNLVFYQIADGYKPGGSGSCSTACLAITGSGNTVEGSGTYRAAVAVAGKMKPGQTSRNATLVSDYLELQNQSGKTDLPTSTSFETYKTFDTQYPIVNDLVLCLDGRNNCK